MNSVDEEYVGLFATLDNRTEGGETASDPVKNYYGAILNVKLVVSQIVVVPNEKTNISLGALVGRNNGLIANCSVVEWCQHQIYQRNEYWWAGWRK